MDLKATTVLKISVVLIVVGNVCFCQEPRCFTSEQLFSGYLPKQDFTEVGSSCERWDELTELLEEGYFEDEPISEAANFCRNPDKSPFYWCYSAPEKSECYDTTSTEYKGSTNVTLSGNVCQRWDVLTPNSHAFADSTAFPDGSSTAAKNYCRDPDGLGTPWCFTTNAEVRWEECNIKQCKVLKDRVRKINCGIQLCEPVSSGCERGWVRSGGGKSCYIGSGKRYPWDVAVYSPDCKNGCLLWKGHDDLSNEGICEGEAKAKLLEVDNEVEYYFLIHAMLKDEKDTFWMGLTDVETEGSFVLRSSGKPANFTDWYTGQPDNFFNRENCVAMYLSKDEGYKWRDDDCTREYNYLCEKDAEDIPETTAEPTTQETSGPTEDTTVVTTITSGCKQPFAYNSMAAVLPLAVHICYLVY